MDDGLLNSVFDWLCKNPDIEIKDGKGPTSTSPTLNSSLAGKRIFASEDRVWQTIAGHGIDHKRIPQREFHILSVVAAHGSAGILQPHVRKLTGQDKRSVPKRTDMLAEKGYIVKENVIGAGAKTSNLKLKRYANTQPVLSAKVPTALAGTSKAPSTIVYYEVWFDTTMRLLKENDNVLSLADLRLHLGIKPNRHENKILRRGINRLLESGCIRCVSALLHDADGNALISVANGRAQKARSIQLLREPTDFDRIKWAQGDSKISKADEVVDDDESIEESDTADADDADPMEVDDDYDNLELLKDRVPPQWTPEVPLVNLVYNIVEEAGPEGISSMDLANRLTGPMWRRPLDQVMALLTDVWQSSQPPHLRHLAIVRDTDVHGKLVHFRYKTYGNFEKTVESGDATWDAVQESASARKKGKANVSQASLDEWDFPKVPMTSTLR